MDLRRLHLSNLKINYLCSSNVRLDILKLLDMLLTSKIFFNIKIKKILNKKGLDPTKVIKKITKISPKSSKLFDNFRISGISIC